MISFRHRPPRIASERVSDDQAQANRQREEQVGDRGGVAHFVKIERVAEQVVHDRHPAEFVARHCFEPSRSVNSFRQCTHGYAGMGFHQNEREELSFAADVI